MYNGRIFYGKLIQADLHGAMDYLKEFPNKKHLVNKYRKRYEKGKKIKHCRNQFINQACCLYDEYYRRMFWRENAKTEGIRFLLEEFSDLLGVTYHTYDTPEETEDAWIALEEKVQKRAEEEGYHYLGGKTQGFYGPYIWKHTKRKFYQVELPHTMECFPVDMMSGFVSMGWLRHLAFGRIGTGGWAAEDGVLCCVAKSYWYRERTSAFRIHFLKHEAQHALDRREYPDIKSMHMEYRAKLVQLIYAKNQNCLYGFIAEGNKQDCNNSHAVASYLITRNLSRMIFGEEYVTDNQRWKRKGKQVVESAKHLYDCYPECMEANDDWEYVE